MAKRFNITGTCFPEDHYMVDISDRLSQIKEMVDNGDYFCINKGRQYGKTTTFSQLKEKLSDDYCVFSISFEGLSNQGFSSLGNIGASFFYSLLKECKYKNVKNISLSAQEFLSKEFSFDENDEEKISDAISDFCILNEKPIVIFIDEVDQASNYDAFLKFLGLLRDKYLNRKTIPAFHSVILAGVYDIKNLKLKLRPEENHKYNSPWNIAAPFKVRMEFDAKDISTMLSDYEKDYQTGMDIGNISKAIEDYTGGYPFLVSRLCMIIHEDVSKLPDFDLKKAWTNDGVLEAVKIILKDENTLFDDMRKKLDDFPGMRKAVFDILYEGKAITFNAYDKDLNIAKMFCFIKDAGGKVAVSNRIFEVWFYNLFVSEASKNDDIISEGSKDKILFVKNDELDMPLILERFIVHFNDIYGDRDEKFVENEGRKYFLFFIKPIINGVGNYYVEARTRDERRTDVVIDYLGHQYVVELKIWHGEIYNKNGEEQLCDYLDSLHNDTGYLLTFNFNKKKSSKVVKKSVHGKTLYEAYV